MHGDGHAVIHGNSLPIFASTARAIRCAYAEVSDGNIASIDAFVAMLREFARNLLSWLTKFSC